MSFFFGKRSVPAKIAAACIVCGLLDRFACPLCGCCDRHCGCAARNENSSDTDCADDNSFDNDDN
jgi:hypothetical protein